MEENKTRGLKMPSAYSILIILIIIISVITHFIYGVKGAVLSEVVMAIPNGFIDAIDVCLFILVLGGFLGVVAKTGALDA